MSLHRWTAALVAVSLCWLVGCVSGAAESEEISTTESGLLGCGGADEECYVWAMDGDENNICTYCESCNCFGYACQDGTEESHCEGD